MASHRALVTGGTGFIGTYVVRALSAAGMRVRVLDVRPYSETSLHVLGRYADDVDVQIGGVDLWSDVVRAVSSCRPQLIVHVAAIVNPPLLADRPSLALRVNVSGTVNVLEAARLYDVPRVIYVSSIGVLPTIQYEPVDADHPVLLSGEGPGAGFYGASKVASESFCLAAVTGMGIDCRIVRPSAVYGLGMQWPIYIKPMVEGAVKGEPVDFGHGGPFPRDYTHVEDVASLIEAVRRASPDADRIFYAATGQPLVTTSELAEVVRSLEPSARISVGQALSEEDLLERPYRGKLSISNAHSQLDWQPRYADIREGVEHYITTYRELLAAGQS